jgi:hypothetical protein
VTATEIGTETEGAEVEEAAEEVVVVVLVADTHPLVADDRLGGTHTIKMGVTRMVVMFV